MLIAIMTITSAIVRKAIGLVAPRVNRSQRELQARPFSTRSQELSFLELQTLAAIVQIPATRASTPNREDASLLWMNNVRRIGDPSGLPIRKIRTANSATQCQQPPAFDQGLSHSEPPDYGPSCGNTVPGS